MDHKWKGAGPTLPGGQEFTEHEGKFFQVTALLLFHHFEHITILLYWVVYVTTNFMASSMPEILASFEAAEAMDSFSLCETSANTS